jgi:SAM-dependent methyltransferase
MPLEMVRSRFAWLTYNEPEGHLDAMVASLAELPGVSRNSLLAGLTYKDDSTLSRFDRRGFQRAYRIDARLDLDLPDSAPGIEAVAAAIDNKRTQAIAARRGQADVFLARHILEHAHAPRHFLEGLAPLVKPGGYLVFELPDSSKFLEACDYSFLWEEHIAYFTPATIRAFIEMSGWEVVDIRAYPYSLEDSIVAVARNLRPKNHARSGDLPLELARGSNFAARFQEVRDRSRRKLSGICAAGRHVAIFGAGHLAAKFLNLYETSEYIDFAVDDNPHKRGLLMPGSRLPIVGSAVLEQGKVDLCLLSLSPESEQKVLSAKASFLEQGGEFRSIFALSPISIEA